MRPFSKLPSVPELLDSPPLKRLLESAAASRQAVVGGVRQFLESLTSDLRATAAELPVPGVPELAERIAVWMARSPGPLRPVINATGIVLHEGLGTPLADAAAAAAGNLATQFSSAGEEWGAATEVQRAALSDLQLLTGAESALVLHSAEAALLAALTALAQGRELAVARSHVGEHRGWRLADIAAAAGARLCEVGAVNATQLDDYRTAIHSQTALLLHSPSAHYALAGAYVEAGLPELSRLAQQRRVPLLADLGIGGLQERPDLGGGWDERRTPSAQAALRMGADLIVLRGNGLMGGPECGLLLGQRVLIQKVAQHPLARACQLDRLRVAALAVTLKLHVGGDSAASIPTLSLLATSVENLRNRAERLSQQLAAAPQVQAAEVVACEASLTSGRLDGQNLPSCGVALTPARGAPADLASALSQAPLPVYARLSGDRLLLDLRTVLPSQDLLLAEAFADRGEATTA